MRTFLAATIALGLACGVPESGDSQVLWLDYEPFEAAIQPILAERCGNPTCHGNPSRPFAVYSTQAYRADPERTYLREPLSPEELEFNYTIACTFVSNADSPEDTLLLAKPLGATRYHGGDLVFEGTTDRDYQTLLDWIESGWPE